MIKVVTLTNEFVIEPFTSNTIFNKWFTNGRPAFTRSIPAKLGTNPLITLREKLLKLFNSFIIF